YLSDNVDDLIQICEDLDNDRIATVNSKGVLTISSKEKTNSTENIYPTFYDVQKVDMSSTHIAMLKSDGTAEYMKFSDGKAEKISGWNNLVDIAAGKDFIIGLDISGRVMGIGENGHIAFNDPWVADFNDKEIIKKVELDEMCRNQQVNDGCFAKLDDVPKFAVTLTVPTLFNADYLFCTVPAKTKAEAVYNTVNAEINEDVPATIMRNHKSAVMYCDKDSAAKLLK
ncbi:MAG: hypothetical protein IKB60_06830, partial [Clostridia bacterium]|nr:hypothetical protein [Clostridia bacterium]